MRCPSPHASPTRALVSLKCWAMSGTMAQVATPPVSGPVASPTASSGFLSHSEWFAAEISEKFSLSHCVSLSRHRID
jgi:hypothetical protein